MIKQEVTKWFNNPSKVRDYLEGVDKLTSSGVLDILQKAGVPVFINNGADPNIMAAQGNYSAGYQTALAHVAEFMLYFENQRIGIQKDSIVPDFGGHATAVKNGYVKL